MAQPDEPQPARFSRDRYPRMIIVCIAISATLSILIASVLIYDFAARSQKGAPETNPKGFEQMLEKPRDAYQPRN